MVREEWQKQTDHDLCQRYLMRKAARLLMLLGLSTNDWDRLEVAAKQRVFEVDKYFPLYPEVYDQDLMVTIRVEARLWLAALQASVTSKKE